jgi:hypothetical protein
MKRAIAASFVVLIAARIIIAHRLDLFGDEAFYWQCAQRLAPAFVDHPPVTAMLVRAGCALLGNSHLGVRLFFLVLAAAIPWAAFWLAKPLVGSRDAWLAAGNSLIIPGFALLGFVAIPDVPMMLFGLLSMALFERATRTGATGSWTLFGVFVGFGLLTHYRFSLFPAAAVLYLLISPRHRVHWRQRGVWIAGLLGVAGLMPSLLYNLEQGFAPVRYYLAGRHDFSFEADNTLEFLGTQALVVTPILFAFIVGTIWAMIRRARGGDDRTGLMLCFSLTILGVFFVASPFDVSGLMTVHWPLPGYLGLLPFLPGTFRSVAGEKAPRWRRAAVVLAPALGAVVVGVVLFDFATDMLRIGTIRRPFTGWTEAAERARELAVEVDSDSESRLLIVADNYKLGGNLEFQLGELATVYVLDHHKNREHGRERQFPMWGIGEGALRLHRGEDALVIVQWSEIRSGHHDEWMGHVASFFRRLEPLGELRVTTAGKSKKHSLFRYYHGIDIQADAGTNETKETVPGTNP